MTKVSADRAPTACQEFRSTKGPEEGIFSIKVQNCLSSLRTLAKALRNLDLSTQLKATFHVPEAWHKQYKKHEETKYNRKYFIW